jgi:hypothetical protein
MAKHKDVKAPTLTFHTAIRQLKPEYGDTIDILRYLLDLANGKTQETHDCHEWEQAIEPVRKVLEKDARYTERDLARLLLEKIRDLCPDDKKHLVKHILK